MGIHYNFLVVFEDEYTVPVFNLLLKVFINNLFIFYLLQRLDFFKYFAQKYSPHANIFQSFNYNCN